MLKVTLIRHGKTYGNTLGRYIGTTDEDLLAEEKQALSAYAFAPVDKLYVSPMKRCVQTAEILFPGQEQEVLPALAECDFGDFENKNYKELSGNEDYQKWIDSGGTLGFPGGESMLTFQARCLRGFSEIVEAASKNNWEEIAIVAHGGTIMSILGAYGIPHRDYFQWHVENGEGYRVRFSPEAFLAGNKDVVVDGQIVRQKAD